MNYTDDIDGLLPIEEIHRLQAEQNNYKDEEIKELLKQRQKIIDKRLKEIKDLKKLQTQENQNIINIQNDIKIKYENNELNLTDKQIKEIEIKKSIIIENVEEEKQYLNLKEYWHKFLIWKIERKKETGREYSNSTVKNFNLGYKYLIEFLDNNEDFNICDFNKRFFINLQENIRKIPSEI